MAASEPLQRAGSIRVPLGRAILRGLVLLIRAAPLGMLISLIQNVLGGLAPAAVAVAGGNLVADAVRAAHSPTASHAAVLNAALLGLALAVMKVGRGLYSALYSLVGYQSEAALIRVRTQAAVSFPGLAPMDDPAVADQLASGGMARSARYLANDVQTILWWGITLVASAVVAGTVVWWAPLGIMAASVPGTWHGWRQARDVGLLTSTAVPELRHADYARDLAVNLEPARELRLFGLGGWVVERQQRRWDAALQPVFARLSRQLRSDLALSALKAAVAVATFVLVGVQAGAGRLGAGELTTAALALTQVAGTAGNLETFIGGMRADTAFLPELFGLADQPARDPRLDVHGDRPPPPTPTRGIAFEGVTFAYPGTARPVLADLDLLLPAGSSMALVGENGAGKSTVVKLLARLYDPDEGRITWDGVDIREWDLGEYRRRLAVVFQDSLRLPVSAWENVGAGWLDPDGSPLSNRELLGQAARLTGADELLEELGSSVLDRQFGGIEPSGGQWQRLMLARALTGRLAGQRRVLVLDEPTAALDVRVEHDLYERFAELTHGLTTLLISHRFSTVRMAQQIAVLEHGHVVEVGSHHELLARGGQYAELWNLQAARFRTVGGEQS